MLGGPRTSRTRKTNENKMGKAGRSTRKMAAKRRSAAFIYLLLAVSVAIVLIALSSNSQALGITGLDLLGVIVVLGIVINILKYQANRQFKAERRAVRGARAEETIEDVLNELGENFYALHDIRSPYGNIDHIVLGQQSGIYLLETKAHGGKVEVLDSGLLVNGKPPEKDFIAQVLRNTYWLKEELKKISGADVWITPVVIFTNTFVLPSKPVKGVVVVNKKYLANTLREGRPSATVARLWEMRGKVGEALAQNRQR